MKRSWKKSVDKLSRDMVGSLINKELMDILKDGRELNLERLDWLLNYSIAQAVSIYSNGKEANGVQFFKNCATKHAITYVDVVVAAQKEGNFDIRVPDAGDSATISDTD